MGISQQLSVGSMIRSAYNSTFGASVRTSNPAIIAVLLLAFTDNVAAQRCSDITTVDFRNSTVTSVRDVDEPLGFRDGVFDEMAPRSPSGPVEWRYEIAHDTTVHPDPQTTIRFIEMFKDHLSGTGSWEYLIGFRCSDGVVRNVFQQAGEGMRVVSLSPDTLHLGFVVWKQGDSHANPSGEKDRWFSWNTSSNTYVETRRIYRERPTDGH